MENNEKMVAAFSEALNVDKSLIKDELAYQSIPEWDSVGHMVLISILEQYFEISIDTQDVIDMSSVGRAKELLGKYGVKF
jgi:acyl carrier protein